MPPTPQHVRIETIESDSRLSPTHRLRRCCAIRHSRTLQGTPYRGIATGRATLRLTVEIAPRGIVPCEVRIDVDDSSVEVCDHRGCFAVTAIDQLFVVERQPPAWRFLTWFGVFARRHGLADRLLVETPEGRVARYVERAIEERLGLRDERVRGEARVSE